MRIVSGGINDEGTWEFHKILDISSNDEYSRNSAENTMGAVLAESPGGKHGPDNDAIQLCLRAGT